METFGDDKLLIPDPMKKIIIAAMLVLAICCQANPQNAVADEAEYIYDDLGRLIHAIYDGRTVITYGYDMAGNREQEAMETDGDADGDGLLDAIELTRCTSPHDSDTDKDGLLDGDEDANHNGSKELGETDPCNEDTDGDGHLDNADAFPDDPLEWVDADGDGWGDDHADPHPGIFDLILEERLASGTYQSIGNIIARGNCVIAPGVNVILKANDLIYLQPDFHVEDGGILTTQMGGVQ